MPFSPLDYTSHNSLRSVRCPSSTITLTCQWSPIIKTHLFRVTVVSCSLSSLKCVWMFLLKVVLVPTYLCLCFRGWSRNSNILLLRYLTLLENVLRIHWKIFLIMHQKNCFGVSWSNLREGLTRLPGQCKQCHVCTPISPENAKKALQDFNQNL